MQPMAAIYFSHQSGAMAKDLGARVRNDGVKTLLLWGDKFRDERDIETGAKAVLIQQSMPCAGFIADSYARFAAGVEIHFVDDDGEFIGGDPADEPVQEQQKDPAPDADPQN